MSKISFALNTKSIDNAIRELETIQNRLDGKCNELALRLARYGLYVARVGFTNAVYEGKKDVSLNIVEVPGGYEIRANSESVCFIEFGTGVGATSPIGNAMGFTPGSWSINHEKQFSTNGYWFYNGKKLTGTPANNCMYNAEKEIKEQIKVFAKEVFCK